jgi:hypothetical protein
MALTNIPSETRKKLRIYMICAGLFLFVLGLLFALEVIVEDLQISGYILMVLGPIDMLMGIILFNPNDPL